MAKTKRALVARMDEDGRALVARYLERNGYVVTTVGTGAQALAELKDSTPDLLIADGVLPKVSGFDLLKEARKGEGRNCAVVLVLEEGDTYGRGRSRAEGVDMMLTEPVLEDDLSEVLNVKAGDGSTIGDVLTSAPSRDRFLKELLRVPAKTDPIVSKISDPLTGLHHKGYMSIKLDEEFKKSRRYSNPLALLFVDIDNYQDVETRYGKPVAQELLLEIAGVFLCESRDVDAAGRVDDARFMLLLPSTDLAGARIMANRVFEQACNRRVRAGNVEVPIKCSVGIAALPSDDVDSVDDFAERALRAMKTASNLGGNRICAFGDVAKTA